MAEAKDNQRTLQWLARSHPVADFFVELRCGSAGPEEDIASGWYNSLDLGRIVADHIAQHLAKAPRLLAMCSIKTTITQVRQR